MLRFDEGEEVTINVTNNLDVMTSVHWHGLILPYQQDGMRSINYDGIKPGENFTYQFTGLAPQWFEGDADVFLSETGDASARMDVEYELLLTKYLILTPSAEVNIAFPLIVTSASVPASTISRLACVWVATSLTEHSRPMSEWFMNESLARQKISPRMRTRVSMAGVSPLAPG